VSSPPNRTPNHGLRQKLRLLHELREVYDVCRNDLQPDSLEAVIGSMQRADVVIERLRDNETRLKNRGATANAATTARLAEVRRLRTELAAAVQAMLDETSSERLQLRARLRGIRGYQRANSSAGTHVDGEA